MSDAPLGDRQPGDVVALASWGGNRTEYGRGTGRRYPRCGNWKPVWVDPRDVAAAPHMWKIVLPEEAGPRPLAELNPAAPRGVDVLRAALVRRGKLEAGPAPAQVPLPVAAFPNFRKVRRLAGAVQLPIFVAPRKSYPSYNDFWQLVELGGFELSYADEIDLDDPTKTYIFSGPDGIPDCSGAKARTIFWQLEYVGDYTRQTNAETAGETWSSDPEHARSTGARFVLLGSHPGLNPTLDRADEMQYDVAMLAYMVPRRQAVKDGLTDLRWAPDYPGHDGSLRHEVLRSTRLMLHVHQYDAPAMTPLRFALAAAYRLPVVSERVVDAGPYKDVISWSNYDTLGLNMMAMGRSEFAPYPATPKAVGEALHRLLCVQHPFAEGVLEALAITAANPEESTPASKSRNPVKPKAPKTKKVRPVSMETPPSATIEKRVGKAIATVREFNGLLISGTQPQIIAFTRLHYGADYLGAVLASTAGFAEKHVILYTPTPSEGFTSSGLACPDSRDELYRIALDTLGERFVWMDQVPLNRATIQAAYPDADIILELDADEVPNAELLRNIRARYTAGELTQRHYGLPFIHYWRSFEYACRDIHCIGRLFLPKLDGETMVQYPDGEANGAVHHFGYARKLDDMRYKVATSAHAYEWRPGWWEDIFLKFPERLTDLHPVCLDGFWNAKETRGGVPLPTVLKDHPYRKLKVIE